MELGKMRTTMKQLLVLSLVAISRVAACDGSASVVTESVYIPKALVLGALNLPVKPIKLHLDTMGSFRFRGSNRASWHYDGSYLQLPLGKRISIPIPRLTVNGLLRRYELFINDFTTDSVEFLHEGSLWKLRILAKDNDKALVVGCINRRKDRPCSFQFFNKKASIRNFHTELHFEISFQGSKVTIVPTDLITDFNYKIHSPPLNLASKIVSFFVNIKRAVSGMIKEKAFGEFQKHPLKDNLSLNVNKLIYDQLLRFLPATVADKASFILNKIKLKSITGEGSQFKITFEFPDEGSSPGSTAEVQSVELTTFGTNVERPCPYHFEYLMRIKTDGQVCGTAYIELPRGRKGPVFSWKAPGAGQHNIFSRFPFSGIEGLIPVNGPVRLVVKYIRGSQTVTVYSTSPTIIARCAKGRKPVNFPSP